MSQKRKEIYLVLVNIFFLRFQKVYKELSSFQLLNFLLFKIPKTIKTPDPFSSIAVLSNEGASLKLDLIIKVSKD